MSARSKARRRALDILFEADSRGVPASEVLDARIALSDPPVNDYTAVLVRGVVENQHRVDELLTTYAEGWRLERMPMVDRNVLRLGAYEVLYADDVPDEVALSQAVNLARELSTDESPAFVNGVLANVARNKTALSA